MGDFASSLRAHQKLPSSPTCMPREACGEEHKEIGEIFDQALITEGFCFFQTLLQNSATDLRGC